MSALYEGCWHKLDWAKKHVDALKRDVGAWTDLQTEPPFTLGKEFHPDLNYFSIFAASVEDVPIEWSLIIGDALTNFRAALDYLAHDLVGRGSKPELRGTDKPQFVICRDSKDFTGQINGRMPGIREADRTIIDSYQPYTWEYERAVHPFALLDVFVRRDKHRQLEPVFAQYFKELNMVVTDSWDFSPTRVDPGSMFTDTTPVIPRFEPNAELVRVCGHVTGSNPDVQMSLQGPIAIAFESEEWVQQTLDNIGAIITQLFSELEPIP